MNEIVFSKHSLVQMQQRGIKIELAQSILDTPQQIILEPDKKVYQSIINFEDKGEYLVRIFVNTIKQPNLVITIYKTSKIEKYYES